MLVIIMRLLDGICHVHISKGCFHLSFMLFFFPFQSQGVLKSIGFLCNYTEEVRALASSARLISTDKKRKKKTPEFFTHWRTDGEVLTTQQEGTLWFYISPHTCPKE